jgi:hypothetical protein
MTIPIDPSGDYSIVEGLEPATFYSKLSEGGNFDSGTPTQVKRMPLKKSETEGDLQLATFGITIHAWASLLNGKEPKYGDRYVIQGKNYIIARDVDVVSLFTRYRCVCMRVPG